MDLTPAKGTGRYISIKADGLFHEKVTKDTDGAVYREYEVKDKEGKVTKGEKWELLYKNIRGVTIKDIAFEDSDFGENILVTFTDGESDITLSENTSGNYGTDIMKKLPNLTFSENMVVQPYSFEDDSGKDRRGVTFWQNGDKVPSYFWDSEKEESAHGFPLPEGDKSKFDKDDWKVFYIGVKKFLVNHTKENVIPKLAMDRVESITRDAQYLEDAQEDINPEDIPF